MVPQELKIVTRSSRLARVQTDEAIAALRTLFPPETKFRIVTLETPGDRDQKTPLGSTDVPDDFFTRDLDESIRRGEADIAVHSAKDLPQTPVAGLHVAALLPARDIRDALVVRSGVDPEKPKVIGTSSPRRESEIKTLFPGTITKPLRGTIDARLARLDAGDFDAIIVAACALERLGMTNRIASHLPNEAAPQQGRLALVVREDATDLISVLRKLDVRRNAGLVAIVGCPADASLLSIRARQYVQHADVVLCDRLIPDDILLEIRDKAVMMGKAGGHKSVSQAEIHRQLLVAAEKGQLVVRLHGGDPGIFGHLGEELDFLSAWNIRADVVPAPTAAQCAAALARTPLTHREEGQRVIFLSARPGAPLPSPADGNLAVYMGVNEAPALSAELQSRGWAADTPVIAGVRLGYRDEYSVATTIGELPKVTIETPAVFLVGLRHRVAPEETTLFVGTDPESFLKYGPLIHFPLIKLISRPLEERAKQWREQASKVRGILFPSRHAVRSFMEAVMVDGDARSLAGKTLLAVGPTTAAELAAFGLRAEAAADSFGGVHALLGGLKGDWSGRYLYPCSDAAPVGDRAASLKAAGIEVVPSVFYMNREVEFRELPRRPYRRVLFTSTSTVKAYFDRHPAELKAKRDWLAVGPSTRRALESLGLHADVIDE